jgi:hypothetical protein
VQAAEEAAVEAKEKEKELLRGNPLMLASEPTFAVKRRCASCLSD